MKTNILWIAGIFAIGIFDLGLYLLLRHKGKKETTTHRTPFIPVDSEETYEEKTNTELPEASLSEKQQLLLQLIQQREENALLQYRMDCAALFEGLSGAIQNMFAFEQFPDSSDAVLCARLEFIAENESLLYRIASRKNRQEPAVLSPETENTDEETLRNMLQAEKNSVFFPSVTLYWEELTTELLPCLENLVQAAKCGQAQDCKQMLCELRSILEAYSIFPVWYHEKIVQENTKMQWDYIDSSSYPVPALYFRTETEYIHVGASGCTGTGYTYPEES